MDHQFQDPKESKRLSHAGARTCTGQQRVAGKTALAEDLLPSLGKSTPSLGFRAPTCPMKGWDELPQIWDPAHLLSHPDHILVLQHHPTQQPITRLAAPSSQHQPWGLLKAQFWSFPSRVNIHHWLPFIFKSKVNQSHVTHKTPDPRLLQWPHLSQDP